MKKAFAPRHLDVKAFAQAGAVLHGSEAGCATLHDFPRLTEETEGRGAELPVRWQAEGAWREGADGQGGAWLRLQAEAMLPLICQRCLQPVETVVQVERDFRFVADEATAEAEDEDAEEDVLALSRDFDLAALLEDEILMEMPLVPRHAVCPTEVPMAAEDADFAAAQAEKPHPFAALAGLKAPKKG